MRLKLIYRRKRAKINVLFLFLLDLGVKNEFLNNYLKGIKTRHKKYASV